MFGDFDKVVKIANEQAELRSTLEGREKAYEMGYGFNFIVTGKQIGRAHV